jgi:DNA-binding NarL/FixJ family response regulator
VAKGEAHQMSLAGQGLKKGSIARELNLSPHTIESYRTNIKQKLGVSTGAELYRIAFVHSENRSPVISNEP